MMSILEFRPHAAFFSPFPISLALYFGVQSSFFDCAFEIEGEVVLGFDPAT